MVLMVSVVPSVYDTNKYTRRTTSIPLLTTGGSASSPYALLPTPHRTLEAFYVGLAQLPSSCFTQHFGKVSQHLGAEVYLGKLSGCSLTVELSENTWVGRLWRESSRRGNHRLASGSSHLFPHYGNTAASGREATAP